MEPRDNPASKDILDEDGIMNYWLRSNNSTTNELLDEHEYPNPFMDLQNSTDSSDEAYRNSSSRSTHSSQSRFTLSSCQQDSSSINSISNHVKSRNDLFLEHQIQIPHQETFEFKSFKQAPKLPIIEAQKGCNCVRSMCGKNYCECYRRGLTCGKLCKCLNCENTDTSADKTPAKEPEGCRCKKNQCQKNYCICLSRGYCTKNCKCVGCLNRGSDR